MRTALTVALLLAAVWNYYDRRQLQAELEDARFALTVERCMNVELKYGRGTSGCR